MENKCTLQLPMSPSFFSEDWEIAYSSGMEAEGSQIKQIPSPE